MSTKKSTRILATVIVISLLAGAVAYVVQIHRRENIRRVIEATHEVRTETDKHVEVIQRDKREYVERVKSRDVHAYEKEVRIRNEVESYVDDIPSHDLGRAIELELELYERGMGAGFSGVDVD